MTRLFLALATLAASLSVFALDHSHKAWDDLLKKHTRPIANGNASQVSYAGFARDRAAFQAVLDDYQKVARSEFDGWSKPRQQAYLINAYNALTIEKIKDFERGHKGYGSVKGTMAKYADLLADKPEDRAAVKGERAEVGFLDYDWSLNDAKS